jgi:hypothetical protein
MIVTDKAASGVPARILAIHLMRMPKSTKCLYAAFPNQLRDPLLKLSIDATGYNLAMNSQWRTADTKMKDFFSSP